MEKVVMATLPSDYLNELFQKEEVLNELVRDGRVDLEEFHEPLKEAYEEGYNGWANK